MNTLVKCPKSTALSKKCNLSDGPTKHRKVSFLSYRAKTEAIGYRKGLYKYDITIYI